MEEKIKKSVYSNVVGDRKKKEFFSFLLSFILCMMERESRHKPIDERIVSPTSTPVTRLTYLVIVAELVCEMYEFRRSWRVLFATYVEPVASSY